VSAEGWRQVASVTLTDVAAELGLSITTVSQAFGGYNDVAEGKRRRVLQAAEDMGYVPSATARWLQKGRTDTMGFVIPTSGPRFPDPFAVQVEDLSLPTGTWRDLLSGEAFTAGQGEFCLGLEPYEVRWLSVPSHS